MKGELTAIIEKAPEGGYWAVCPEVPGANGQGETIEEAKENLRQAVRLIIEDRLEDFKRGFSLILRLCFNQVHGPVKDVVCNALLSVQHQVVHESRNQLIVELRIR